jgi:hypothetical protein
LFASGCSAMRGTPVRYPPTEVIVEEIKLAAADLAALAQAACPGSAKRCPKGRPRSGPSDDRAGLGGVAGVSRARRRALI